MDKRLQRLSKRQDKEWDQRCDHKKQRMMEDKKGEEFWGKKKESRMRRENIAHRNINLSI